MHCTCTEKPSQGEEPLNLVMDLLLQNLDERWTQKPWECSQFEW